MMMSDELWSDERISAKAREIIVLGHTPLGAIRRVAYEVRDDYEAQLAALRAQVAELEAQLAAAQTKVPSEARWISVGETLPEEYAWVLVYADDAINCMGYAPGKGFEDWVLQQSPNIVIQEITHWRRLPSGPAHTPKESQS